MSGGGSWGGRSAGNVQNMWCARRSVGSFVALLLALVLVLTACQVDVRVDVAVDDDGSGTVTVEVALDQEASDRIPDLAEQLRTDDLEAAGWTVTGPDTGDDGVTRVSASKPFDDPDEAAAIIDEIAGPDGPFQDFSVTRSTSFAETRYAVEGVADFGDGFADFTDERVADLLGDGFGGNLDEIQADTGQDPAEQVSITFAAELPGAGVQEVELDPTSAEPQRIEARSTSTRWATRAWTLVAGLALVLLVVVVVLRLVRDQRERREVALADERDGGRRIVHGPASPEARDGEPAPAESASDQAPADAPDGTAAPAGEPAATPPPPRPKRRLGVVVLDAMGVVFDTGVDVPALLTDFLHGQGIYLPHDEVAALYTRATLGEIGPDELWRALGVERNQREATDQFLALHKVSPGVRLFLERMRERSLPVVVVANDVGAWSHQLRETHKLTELTAGWIVSSELGHRLPDAVLYDEVGRISGEEPRNTFFIGRELRYLAAARAHGFATAWFNPEPEPGDEDAGYPMIRSFRDLGLG